MNTMKPEKDYADVYVEAYKRVYIDENYKRSSKNEHNHSNIYHQRDN